MMCMGPIPTRIIHKERGKRSLLNCVCLSPIATFSLSTGELTIERTVSQDPANYRDAPTEGIRRILEIVTGDKLERGSVLPTNKIGEPIVFNSCHPFLQVQIHILHCTLRLHSSLHYCSHQRPPRTYRTAARPLHHRRLPRSPPHRQPIPSQDLRSQHPQTTTVVRWG